MSIFDLLSGIDGVPSYQVVRRPVGKRRKLRDIAEGNAAHEAIQRALGKVLAAVPIVLPSATGCAPGCSPLGNALAHKESRFFYILDFKAAYPSVSLNRLTLALMQLDARLGTAREVRNFLGRYFHSREYGLLQGAHLSPLLFNIYCERWIDRPLRALLSEGNIVYTRYVDDLAFSSTTPIMPPLRKKIRRIVTQAGFRINVEKTRYSERGKDAIEITGIRFLTKGLGLTDFFLKGDPSELRPGFEGFESKLDWWRAFPDVTDTKRVNELVGLIGYYKALRPQLARNRVRDRLDEKVGEALTLLTPPRPKTRFSAQQLETLGKLAPLARVVDASGGTFSSTVRGGKARCPFCSSKGKSFRVFNNSQRFHCFKCGANGNVFEFVKRRYGLSFTAAVRWVADYAGVSVEAL